MRDLWKQAARMDTTLRIRDHQWERLAKKRVSRAAYSPSAVFTAMARQEVAIYSGIPVLVKRRGATNTPEAVANAIATQFPPRETSRVQVGPHHRLTRLPVREIMKRWSGGRAIVGVTDLHIRGSRLENIINTRSLSNFNLLIRGSEDLAAQEMMTLVIASAGNVTDSHSDDPDGTNHCFVGSKLWLAWDAFEGMAKGLQDDSRQTVYSKARFDMDTFLSLKSSSWFTVSTGDTLILPGNLTHKVLTLEPYLGIGSFHVGLPGCLHNLTRWLHHGPLWSIDDPRGECAGLVNECIDICFRHLRRCQDASPSIKARWGFNYVGMEYRAWLQDTPASVRREVCSHPTFRQIVELARRLGNAAGEVSAQRQLG